MADAARAAFRLEGWGDGFPLLLPTADRVARMLERNRIEPSSEIGAIPPRNGAVQAQQFCNEIAQ